MTETQVRQSVAVILILKIESSLANGIPFVDIAEHGNVKSVGFQLALCRIVLRYGIHRQELGKQLVPID